MSLDPSFSISKLFLPAGLLTEMQAQVERLEPQEVCGLVGGTIQGNVYYARAIFPVTNALHSTVRYRMEPREQLTAFEAIDAQGWQVVGIYHSHPTGPEQPSPTDIAEAYYPEAVYLVWFRHAKVWECRGFSIQAGRVNPVPLDDFSS
jgi:proteasome lid subunit RPN8/RPN11